MVWVMVTGALFLDTFWPRRTYLRSRSLIFSAIVGARDDHEAVAVVLE